MKKSPAEVINAILLNWREQNLSLENIAADLGYSRKQALHTFLYRKRKNEAYFSIKEASKYSKLFGYNPDFLISGEGHLRAGSLAGALEKIDDLQFRQLKLMSQLSIAYAIMKRASNPLACDALRAIAENKLSAYLAKMRALMESNGGYDEANAHTMVAYFACIESLDKLKKHFRNLDVPAMTEMVRKEYEDIKESI